MSVKATNHPTIKFVGNILSLRARRKPLPRVGRYDLVAEIQTEARHLIHRFREGFSRRSLAGKRVANLRVL